MGEIRIYTDESVDVAIAQGLQRRGVEAFSQRDRDKLGLTDEDHLIFASEEKSTIFTHDNDFLRIVAQWTDDGRTHCGVIYCHQLMTRRNAGSGETGNIKHQLFYRAFSLAFSDHSIRIGFIFVRQCRNFFSP